MTFPRDAPLEGSPTERDTELPSYQCCHSQGNPAMSRAGAVTFKGNPMTLAGNAVSVGQQAPSFKLHSFDKGGLAAVTPADFKGKPTFISVVPSLDTPVCQTQTKKFN